MDILSNKNLVYHLLVFFGYGFVTTAVDEAFPLFCISKEAGIGLSEVSIGKILSLSGILFASLQYFVYTAIVDRMGVYPSLKIGTLLSSPIVCLIPISIVLNKQADYSEMTRTTFLFLGAVFAIFRIFSSTFMASITLAINRLVPPSQRGTLNGYSMLGTSVAKTCGPTFAGWIVSFFFSSGLFPPHLGAVMVFAVIALLGLGVFSICFLLDESEVPSENESNK